MKVKETAYLYAAARLRALEREFITREALERMLEAKNAAEAGKVLAELMPDCFSDEKLAVDEAVAKMRKAAFALVREISPNPELLNAFRIKYDYHNIKAIIKSAARGRSSAYLMSNAGRVEAAALEDAVTRGALDELPGTLRAAYLDARDTLARTSDPRAADLVIDRAYFSEMLSVAEAAGSEFLLGYVRSLVDAANLRTVVRAYRFGKRAESISDCLIPGGRVDMSDIAQAEPDTLARVFANTSLEAAAQEGARAMTGETGFTVFERLCDDAAVEYIRAARYRNFGDAPLVAYLAAKENDAMLIRILMAAKQQGLAAGKIRDRLRVTYV